jgi:NAD(P)H-hydrate epimerase
LIANRVEAYDALIIGPGLGVSAAAQEMVRLLLTSSALANVPTVIDADAINALARIRGWQDFVQGKAVLTPHPGELARLLGTTTAGIQADRLAAARDAAERLKQTVVLKGAHTLVAAVGGEMLISPFANAALAAAGTGDVLAGTIGGLLAQGLDAVTAAGAGVYLHGAAAELYEDYGPSGLLASELGIGIARVAGRLRRGE